MGPSMKRRAPVTNRDRPSAAPGAPPPLRWALAYAGMGLLVGILLSSLAAGAWLAASGDPDLSIPAMELGQIGLWIGLAGSAVWSSRAHGTGSLSVDFGLRMRPLDAVVGPAVGLVSQLGLVSLIALLLSPLVGHPDVSQDATDLVRKAHGVGLAGLVVFVVIGAPIVEELFFRGLVLRGLRQRMPDAFAVVISALLFGMAHFQEATAGGLVLVVSLFAFGVVLAVLAVRSGRLGPGIWAHATFNAFTVIALLLT